MPLLSSYPDRTLTRVLGHDSGLLVGKARIRELLTAARTYYVRSDGTDAGTGLVNASSASAPNCAKLTFAGAFSDVCSLIDFGGQTVTISMQNTTWTTTVLVDKPWTGGGSLIVDVNTGTISTSAECFIAEQPGDVTLQNVTVTSSGASCIVVGGGGGATLALGAGIVFGQASVGPGRSHMECNGGSISANSNYSIIGGAGWFHAYAVNMPAQIYLFSGTTVTITGTPLFSGGFVNASTGGIIQGAGVTYSGAVNAGSKRYLADTNGVIQTFTSGVNTTYFPGGVAGTTSTGGQYQ